MQCTLNAHLTSSNSRNKDGAGLAFGFCLLSFWARWFGSLFFFLVVRFWSVRFYNNLALCGLFHYTPLFLSCSVFRMHSLPHFCIPFAMMVRLLLVYVVYSKVLVFCVSKPHPKPTLVIPKLVRKVSIHCILPSTTLEMKRSGPACAYTVNDLSESKSFPLVEFISA
jgi:hypothetical protein